MAAPSHIGSNTQDSAGALSLTFVIPAATTTDDLMICFVKQSENTSAQIWDDDGGGSNGWTREIYNRTTSGRDMECAIFWKFATSGSETNPTFTWDDVGTSEPMSGILEVYRGVDKVSPFSSSGITYLNSTNDANPPNPAVTIDAENTRVVVFHGATHDDISAVSAPTGFTLRSQVWAGTSNDHRNVFSADLEVDTLGSYTPPDWQHSVLNTTPEYQTYSVALNEALAIHLLGGTALSNFHWVSLDLTVTGDGFETTQGTGKVEYWSDVSGTIKVEQTVDSWSATSIQFDANQGALGNNTTVYLVVTNDSGDVSAKIPIDVGLKNYADLVTNTLRADHYWPFQNNYNDEGDTGPARNATTGVVGTWTFTSFQIRDGATHALEFTSKTNRRECSDSPNMNITINSSERTIAFWFQVNGIQKSLASIWKEGGGVQNLAFLTGYGNTIIFQAADNPGNAINAQAWSDFKLTPGRPYHICGRYSLTEDPKVVDLHIDGVLQTDSTGNPLGTGSFDSHSGDVCWGDTDTSLETGGTDIAYQGCEDAVMSDFASWSDNSIGADSGFIDATTGIQDILFRRGALPDDTIVSDTQSAMQTALDATADTRPDWPLSYRIEGVSGGGDLELVMNSKVFDPRITLHLEYRGTGTLTIINETGSNLESYYASAGGNVVVVPVVPVTVTCTTFQGVPIENARVLLKAAAGGDLPFEDAVTITRTSSTATVTHTSHGLRTGLKIAIKGAAQHAYNGIKTITVTGANTYTYPVTGTPASPATGSILATAVILEGLSDASGVFELTHRYTSDQPVSGAVRKGSPAPHFKSTPISGTITATGLPQPAFMISDE